MARLRKEFDVTVYRPLHDRLPELAARVAHVPLATLPTPLVQRETDVGTCLLKLDGHTHDVYGGNKVRKLEYVLAQARAHGARRVATFGAAGSNHATATAVHARAVGLECVTFLSRQRPTPWIAGNLARQVHAGARIVFVDGIRGEREARAREVVDRLPGKTWRIPMGGSSLAGTLGYINAGLELAQQLADCEPPDRLYVPLGTMGTAVGLTVGLALAGVRTPVHAVRVVHETVGSAELAQRLMTGVFRVLRRLTPACKDVTADPAQLIVRNEFFGSGYAAVTPEAREAVHVANDQLGIALETTYSGKTFAALLADQQDPGRRADRPLLVCTYQSQAPAPPDIKAENLPPALRTYLTAHQCPP